MSQMAQFSRDSPSAHGLTVIQEERVHEALEMTTSTAHHRSKPSMTKEELKAENERLR